MPVPPRRTRSAQTAPTIFISYRSGDEPLAAVLLDRVLSDRYGPEAVFLDDRSIGPTDDFTVDLRRAVRRSAILLVVAGTQWLTATDHYGRRLLDSRKDWVRTEITEARSAGALVMPVLVGDAPVMPENGLPAGLRWLARCQYARLRTQGSAGDLDDLIRRLEKAEPRLAKLVRRMSSEL